MKWDKLTPVGINARTELYAILAALGAAVLWSLTAVVRIVDHMNGLTYTSSYGANAIAFSPYRPLLGTALDGFFLVALLLVFLALGHYLYHRRGARTDYLMRRLPRPWEYHLRCLALPVLGIVLALALAAIGYFGCRALYRTLLARVAKVAADRGQHLYEWW